MTVKLKELFLGYADGETESNEECFEDLFYVGNNKYDEITDNPMKFIIRGQKGTGKTILGRYIEKVYTSKGIITKTYRKEDLTLSKLIEKNNSILSNDEAIHLFKWIIYVKIFNLIKDISIKNPFKFNKEWWQKRKEIQEYNKSIKIIRDIYDERYGANNYENNEFAIMSEEIRMGEVNIENSTLKGIKAKGQLQNKSGFNGNYVKKEFYKLLECVEKNILKCLKLQSVVIILDDLDELEIKFEDSKDSLEAIKQLIEALKNINNIFLTNKLQPSKCILLLRSDILESINKNSTNMNKIILDNSVELYWIDKENINPEKHMLMEMILNKIKLMCDRYKDMSNEELYRRLFPEKINGENVVNYLINNSFGRPRDIITYLILIRERNPEASQFTAKMFKECKQAYSEAILRELYNEMKVHIELNVIEDYINLVRTFGRNTFFESNIKKYYRSKKKSFSNINDLRKCLETLYRFGVIGNSWKVNKGKTNETIKYSWGYRKDGNPLVNYDQRFSVHYGLRKMLNTN